jgi:methylthioribose-1-phosphate isomerase
MPIETIAFRQGKVYMIDQRVLPQIERELDFSNCEEVALAIERMVIRGAPAIGIAAAMGLALGARELEKVEDTKAWRKEFEEFCERLLRTRPTAVNLSWAVERMRRVADEHLKESAGERARVLEDEARRILDEDIAINREIGKNGSRLLEDGDAVLTHCNAGALATGGYGTALGVIRAAVESGKGIRVYADETRPFLQGARLTAWELMQDNIPVTLICDNMAGSLMRQGRIQKVIVGADRIARNGDTANKIGTYPVAVLAMENGIPFYVAAPVSTIDLECETGDAIPIEERNRKELTHIFNQPIAPEGVDVWNPAFDVTPARLVTAIITEKGVAEPRKINGLIFE